MTSHVHISIPAVMVDSIRKFEIGETVKMKCNMGYSQEHHCLLLSGETIEKVSNVKIIVK